MGVRDHYDYLYCGNCAAERSYGQCRCRIYRGKSTGSQLGDKRNNDLTTYKIVVSYNGKNYDLKNAHDSYSYRQGSTVTAYLSNDKMYANVEGVQNSTPAAIAYFAALIGSIVMFFVTICLWANVAQQKRRANR